MRQGTRRIMHDHPRRHEIAMTMTNDDENDNDDGDDECGNDVLNYDRDRARIWASLVMTEVDDNGSNTTAMATTTTSIFSLAFDVSSSWGGWG